MQVVIASSALDVDSGEKALFYRRYAFLQFLTAIHRLPPANSGPFDVGFRVVLSSRKYAQRHDATWFTSGMASLNRFMSELESSDPSQDTSVAKLVHDLSTVLVDFAWNLDVDSERAQQKLKHVCLVAPEVKIDDLKKSKRLRALMDQCFAKNISLHWIGLHNSSNSSPTWTRPTYLSFNTFSKVTGQSKIKVNLLPFHCLDTFQSFHAMLLPNSPLLTNALRKQPKDTEPLFSAALCLPTSNSGMELIGNVQFTFLDNGAVVPLVQDATSPGTIETCLIVTGLLEQSATMRLLSRTTRAQCLWCFSSHMTLFPQLLNTHAAIVDAQVARGNEVMARHRGVLVGVTNIGAIFVPMDSDEFDKEVVVQGMTIYSQNFLSFKSAQPPDLQMRTQTLGHAPLLTDSRMLLTSSALASHDKAAFHAAMCACGQDHQSSDDSKVRGMRKALATRYAKLVKDEEEAKKKRETESQSTRHDDFAHTKTQLSFADSDDEETEEMKQERYDSILSDVATQYGECLTNKVRTAKYFVTIVLPQAQKKLDAIDHTWAAHILAHFVAKTLLLSPKQLATKYNELTAQGLKAKALSELKAVKLKEYQLQVLLRLFAGDRMSFPSEDNVRPEYMRTDPLSERRRQQIQQLLGGMVFLLPLKEKIDTFMVDVMVGTFGTDYPLTLTIVFEFMDVPQLTDDLGGIVIPSATAAPIAKPKKNPLSLKFSSSNSINIMARSDSLTRKDSKSSNNTGGFVAPKPVISDKKYPMHHLTRFNAGLQNESKLFRVTDVTRQRKKPRSKDSAKNSRTHKRKTSDTRRSSSKRTSSKSSKKRHLHKKRKTIDKSFVVQDTPARPKAKPVNLSAPSTTLVLESPLVTRMRSHPSKGAGHVLKFEELGTMC